MTASLDTSQIRAILLDIEGTTTPIEFVYDVLFPYARNHVKEFILQHHRSEEVRADIEGLRKEHAADLRQNLAPRPWRGESLAVELESAVAYVHWLMDRDRKSTPLKSLQGKVWKAGYHAGELRGEVYADVPPALTRWQQQGKVICIFSSGSVLAQKLLFGNTTAGDLTRFLHAYFDTTTGAKTEPDSYRRIAAALDLPTTQILFLSDATPELDAARLAGCETALCLRPGRPGPPAPAHPVIRTFDEILA